MTARWRAIWIVVLLVGVAGCAAVSQLNIVSEEQELQMGAQFAESLRQDLTLITDPRVVSYIDSLGQVLARASKRNYIPYTFHVVDTEDVNAFAVPGGYLYVNRGLIEAAESESELAGVLGHEIGHVVGRHSARQISQQYGLQILASLALGQEPNALASMTANILSLGAISKYGRDMETEADTYGVQELYDVGLDPEGLATFFEKLEEMRGGREAGAVEKFFASHPDPGARAAAVRAQIAALPYKPGLRRDSDRFHRIQEIVKRLPPSPKREGQ